MRSVNIDGLLYLAQATLPHLEASGSNLVAVSSVSGLAGDWGWPAYNATKGAVANLVRALDLDWGRRGVRVNSIAPGVTASEWVAPVLEIDGVRKTVENRTALGGVGEPAEVAAAILFVASDAASYITGAVMPVDGGTSASSGLAHFE
ncbi:SDR family oxidoreductase [Deinococcus sp. HMF7620]|uniref:SDR family oxidoreductase n=1 Tax=Deinococcus arboris TaxID=2682977 RepID=A0A7C9LSK3_9DEIO|nr:SDR family oxidoreductase [Deinococcus arboris]MVN88241.1 SDR family oxidoreductase [Deinococcus arboris]